MKPEKARKYMEKAIEVMRDSVSEPRDDGKVSPKVGAVLVMPDGFEETASRGEYRYGDHAEFTLLERKLRQDNVTGATLFATLEPCTPGSRNHPKLGCAERIYLARVSEVWIGVEDPDPTVDRKGIKYLQDQGISVKMFDPDLQEMILAENSEFFKQARERAMAEEETPEEVSLSTLEEPVSPSDLDDFSHTALDAFRSAALISEPIDSPKFQARLEKLKMVERVDGELTPTGFGMLLFGKEPRDVMQQAGVLATIHYPGGNDETWDFDGPQVLVPEKAMKWLKDKLPNVIDRSKAQAGKSDEPFFELIREGIANALVHRDYDIREAKIQLEITPDTVDIRSPGLPVKPITIEQMKTLKAPMLSRNPILHFVFRRMGLAEERGLGLKSLRERAQELGLPLPTYIWEAPYLILRLFRTQDAAVAVLPQAIRSKLNEAELDGWEWLTRVGTTTSAEYAHSTANTKKTAQRHLKRFVDMGLARKTGAGPSTAYEVVR